MTTKEQAAAHRATKGTRRERLDRLDARLFEREVYAWSGSREEDVLRTRHVKVMTARRAS